jgi:ribbon-helix-helix CopG family protein
MRTIIDLTERQLAELDHLAKVRDTSRAELVRRAVDRYLTEDGPDRDAGFGLWKRSGAKEDGLAFQRRMRKGWQS